MIIRGLMGMLLIGVVVSGCSSSAATYQVTGTALATPGCPVERPGEKCPPIPVVEPVTFMSDDQVVAQVTSGPDGSFAVSLPNGTYSVDAHAPLSKSPPICPITQVTVSNGPVTIAIKCDSGIR
jgi:hypothetical protein